MSIESIHTSEPLEHFMTHASEEEITAYLDHEALLAVQTKLDELKEVLEDNMTQLGNNSRNILGVRMYGLGVRLMNDKKPN